MKPDRTVTVQCLLVLSFGLTPDWAVAQVVPDTTLPVNSMVTPNGNAFTIDGGTQSGGNLFHSFQDFSIPTGTEAFFNNALDVQNIFSRVTGGNLSHIDGLIRANGTANLFVLNPAGLIFGENASLNIGGSFVATSAESLVFGEGLEFSAVQPNAAPLLTVNIVPGLQMGSHPGNITAIGTGHHVTLQGISLLQRGVDRAGLQVRSGNSITLVGGNISLEGGLLVADSGNIELAAFSNGEWQIGKNRSVAELLAAPSAQFGNIQLRSSALADTSGIAPGFARVWGRSIELQEGSAIVSQNFGSQTGGEINVRASERLAIIGSTANLPSILNTQTLGTGAGGDINVNSPDIFLQDGGSIQAQTFGSARSGDLNIRAPQLLQVTGANAAIATNRTGLANGTFGSGDTGSLNISTGRLIVRDGATGGSTVTLGTGNSGQVVINASESIDLSGFSSISPSDINAISFGAGNGGSIVINTPRLTIGNGANVSSGTVASGHAGNITIRASEAVKLLGADDAENLLVSDAISSAATSMGGTPLQALLGLPDRATGDSGNVTIDTPDLSMRNGARISVANDSTGKAGSIALNVNALSLENTAAIVASTASGNGGNIAIAVRDSLQLRRQSAIEAASLGIGNGGNIDIDTATLALLENSQISATAIQGTGGNIQIATHGLFASGDSGIAASSRFGVNGVVTITNPEVDPSSSLVHLSQETVDPSEQVVAGCQWTGESEFVATRRGGIAANPNRPFVSSRTWSDVRDLSAFRQETMEVSWIRASTPERLVEATGWVLNWEGKPELVAATQTTPGTSAIASECNPLSPN